MKNVVKYCVYLDILLMVSIYVLSATDQHFAFRKIRMGAKDRLSFKISHFAVQILPVDIHTKVRKFQEFTKIPGRELTDFGIETSS